MKCGQEIANGCILGILIIFGTFSIIACGPNTGLRYPLKEAEVALLATNNLNVDQDVITTDSNGYARIQSDELPAALEIRVQPKEPGNVSNVKIQWRASNGKIEFIVYDSKGYWAPVIYQGNPFKNNNSKNKRSKTSPALMDIEIQASAVGEYNYHIHELDNPPDNWQTIAFSNDTINKLCQHLISKHEGKKCTLLIGDTKMRGDIPSWKAYVLNIETSVSALTNFIIDKINFGTADADTKIWFQAGSWESLDNRFFDTDLVILPSSWDDKFQEDYFNNAVKDFYNVKANGLMVTKEYSDFFEFELNSDDILYAKASFLKEKGDINLQLYDYNYREISLNSDMGDFEEISYVNTYGSGKYYLKVYLSSNNEQNNWPANMYNLEISHHKKSDWVTNMGNIVTIQQEGDSWNYKINLMNRIIILPLRITNSGEISELLSESILTRLFDNLIPCLISCKFNFDECDCKYEWNISNNAYDLEIIDWRIIGE